MKYTKLQVYSRTKHKFIYVETLSHILELEDKIIQVLYELLRLLFKLSICNNF